MSEEKDQVIDTAQGMIAMYKQGYLDSYLFYIGSKDKDSAWDSVKDSCAKCFEARFVKKTKNGIKFRLNKDKGGVT